MTSPVYYDTHMHTPLCKHAYGEPEDYARAALDRGLKGIIVTCHNPTENNAWNANSRMAVAQFDDYVGLVERARRSLIGRADVRLGLESDYAPGMEPWLEKLHSLADLHYVLGSIHPHCAQYQERYLDADLLSYQRTYFDHIAMAAETGLFDAISHPDLVKNVDPDQWHLDQVLDDVRACLDRIAAAGVAMELNTSGLHKAVQEMNPGVEILSEMHRRNIPVVIGSDAHTPDRVGADFELALDTLKEVGYSNVSIFLDRRRTDLEIDLVCDSMKHVE